MIAYQLISETIAPLHLNDTGEQALTMMSIYHVKHLPVVSKDKLIGIISEDEIMANDLEKHIKDYELMGNKPFVVEKDHLFEVLSKIAEHRLTVMPVADSEMFYLGSIKQEDLIIYHANSFSFKEPGSVVVLETEKRNYSLAEISRIVEEENGTILSTFLTAEDNSDLVLVTLKIAAENFQGILSSFERYEYVLKGSFVEDDFKDSLQERYDALMTYLNV